MFMVAETQRKRNAAFLRAICAAKYVHEDDIPCQIEEGIILGSVGVALNKEALKNLNVTHVLIVAKSLDPAFPNDFTYKKIDVLDTSDTNLKEHFKECFDFIDSARKEGGGVLVHCFAGRSRSVTIILAYLIKKHRMSLSHALELVRCKRPQVCPNRGFMIQLLNLEKSLEGSVGGVAGVYRNFTISGGGTNWYTEHGKSRRLKITSVILGANTDSVIPDWIDQDSSDAELMLDMVSTAYFVVVELYNWLSQPCNYRDRVG